MVKDIQKWVKPNGKPFAAATRFNTIQKKYQPYKEIFLKNKEFPSLVDWFYEKKVLGYSYSTNLRKIFSDEDDLVNCNECNNNLYENDKVHIVGEVIEKMKGRSKKSDKKYLKLTIADESGKTTCMLYGEKVEQYLQHNEEPNEKSIVLIEGRKGRDIVWLDRMSIQDYKVYMKMGDIRKGDVVA
jgi:DNA polymerase III alpha subunit